MADSSDVTPLGMGENDYLVEKPVSKRPAGYFQLTATPTYGYLFALPLLVLYEIAIIFANAGAQGEIRIGAELWMKQLLQFIQFDQSIVFAVLVVLIGVAVFYNDRDKKIGVKPGFFGITLIESTAYAVLLAIIISRTVGMIFNALPMASLFQETAMGQQTMGLQLALSLGAGLYEELFFRVILVGGLYWVMKQFAGESYVTYIVVAVIGALIFSWVHYIGALGDPFELPSFTFRFLFGLALNVLYLVRGFGVAAWTHAIYDVIVTLHLL